MFLEEFPNIKIDKNDTKSLRENISKILREGIYSGFFPPGLRLVESELAKKFKISRTPVREALLQLESEGIIKILPNKGAIVTAYSIDEIEEIYLIFGALSGIAAGLSVESIKGHELKQMEAILEKMDICKYNKDRREWFILNNEFHSSFLRPCKKKILLKLIRNYTKQVGLYWYLLLSHPTNVELFSEEHRSILEAFKSKNSKEAKERVENHIRSFGKIVVESLKSISTLELNYLNVSEKKAVSFIAPMMNYLFSHKRKEIE